MPRLYWPRRSNLLPIPSRPQIPLPSTHSTNPHHTPTPTPHPTVGPNCLPKPSAVGMSAAAPQQPPPPAALPRSLSKELQQQQQQQQAGASPKYASSPLSRGSSSRLQGVAGARTSGSLGSTPRAAHHDANSASAKQADLYISELLSFSLERLRKEPELLAEERQHVARSMQSAALSHYHAFIGSAQCLGVVEAQLGRVCEGLEGLSAVVPDMAGALDGFSRDAAAVMAQRASNKQLLTQQSTLLELLDAPQLMDTCVRNGVYDEALDLHALLTRVALLHPDMPIAKMLAAQAQAVSRAMLAQLLGRLRTNIALPECLRVIGYLRRMAAFSEAELRLQFLRCREDWLTQLVAELDDSEPYEFVKHLTDVHRLHLFDVVMQYRAIFFDSTSLQEPAKPGALLQHNAAGAAAMREGCVLYTWVQHRIAHYLASLQQALPRIDEGTSLAAVLEHCMYCCSSLSRVGLDFSCLLQGAFQGCVLQLFASRLALAVEAFHTRLDSHRWVAMPTPVFQKQQQDSGGSGGTSGPAAGQQQQQQQQALNPPYELMEHVPLAVFTNGVLSALNELRHCALLPLQRPAGTLLQGALEQVASSLVHYRHTRTLGDGEAALFTAAVRALSDTVVTYVAACFGSMFAGGGALLSPAAVTGILQDVNA